MMKRTALYKGLTALVISSMLVTVPAVPHMAYADEQAAVETEAKEQKSEETDEKAEKTEKAEVVDSEEDGTNSGKTEAGDTDDGKTAGTETKDEDTKDSDTKDAESKDEETKDGDTKDADTKDSDTKKENTSGDDTKADTGKDAAAEFKANIAKLKAYEGKLDELTAKDVTAIQELLDAVSAYLEDNADAELSDETEAFLSTISEKLNSASIMTLGGGVATPTELKSINQQIKKDKSQTIIVSSDITEDVVIPDGYSITLKINDGVTLTNVKDHTITVKKGGFLSIDGEGTIDNVTHGKAALKVEEDGEAFINSGTFTRSKEAGTDKDNSGGNSYYYIQNHGKLTINDAEVYSEGHFSSLIQNGYYDYSKENKSGYKPTLIINGGTFSGGINTIKNDDDGILYINGGEFSNTTQYALMNCNVATITDGTFSVAEGSKYDAVWNRYAGSAEHDAGKMTINGGSFEDSIWSNDKSELTITGIDSIEYINADKDAKLSLTATPEKASDKENSYSFLGWFNQYGGTTEKPGDLKETVYKYKPTYLATKIEANSSKAEITDSAEDETKDIVSDSVQELINSIVGSSDSKVKYDTEAEVDLYNILIEAISAGEDIAAKVVLEDVDAESEIVKEAIAAIEEIAGNKTLAQYVDIDIELLVAGAKKANITELNDEIEITMDLPEALQASNRKFTVIRFHDGEAEALDTETLSGGKQISFKSKLFSLYAIGYEEVEDNSTTGRSSARNRSNETSTTAVSNGTWMQDAAGWWFKKADGSYPKDTWYECVWNGVSNWYHFNAQGYADGGWLTDKDGQRYYLHNAHDGKFGFMYTGWKQIDGKWYYFNTSNIATGLASEAHSIGSLVTNATTTDGYKVGADGSWIQ